MGPIVLPNLELLGIVNHFLILMVPEKWRCSSSPPLKRWFLHGTPHHFDFKQDNNAMINEIINCSNIQVDDWTTGFHHRCWYSVLSATTVGSFWFQWHGCFYVLWRGWLLRWFWLADVFFFSGLLDKADDMKPVNRVAPISLQWCPQALTKCFKGSLQIPVLISSCISKEWTRSLVFTKQQFSI